ncbi:MAG: hypothetical protein NTX71_09360 [Candidatus Aureabacteria bacterium]|nr:hypothetical protein [Candidatus Auribacterota bacterium]
MKKLDRFIIWICSKFNRKEIEFIVAGLVRILVDRNPEVKPRDDFKEKHPNYRNFSVDPLPPISEPLKKKIELVLGKNFLRDIPKNTANR